VTASARDAVVRSGPRPQDCAFRAVHVDQDVGEVHQDFLLVWHRLPNYVDAQPTKLFEYMMAGLPVVSSDFPRWREIIEPANCGLLVDPSSEDEISAAVQWLLEHPEEAREMGERGRREVRDHYSWDAEGKRLVRMYASLLGAPNGAADAEEVR
jgi:glycosyltransferase involved in cell wall biosynthesis